jgi:peptidylprolyl isomerase
MNTSSNSSIPVVSGAANSMPVIAAPHGTPPTTLLTQDVIAGSGATAVSTSTLTVHYTLMAWSTGKVVESSWTSGQPATFALAQVIPGWQQGIPGMKIGGRRVLVIPPSLGYGAAGAGPIGPNETLVFVVDLLAIA